ncbi:hypothetical protein LTR09_010411 [Extremus antarcticus]|uniref:DNA/RNA-binding protein Alba-like domain-containing protein n=1 Tax=Extremus antarcticus TaxID=702011 RepID=A0AAJ0G8N7_9PEZI|nr:hypothetical protein LTR09_010411 [Extremus antarcticus]
MQLSETQLSQKYELVKFSVHSSTQISSRTTAVTTQLGTVPAEGSKPVIVALTARSKAANKLISIVEIAKRDLSSKGITVYQYNALSSEMTEIPRGGGKADGGNAEVCGKSEDEGAFEAMGPEAGATKKRLMPVMTTYLTNVAVKELKTAYGEHRCP